MKKKKRGHYCRIYGEHKPNEKFSRKGHARHVFKALAKQPVARKGELQRDNQITEIGMSFVIGFKKSINKMRI